MPKLDPDIEMIASMLNDPQSPFKKGDFAEALGIGKSSVSSLLKGGRRLGKEEALAASKFLKVVLPSQASQTEATTVPSTATKVTKTYERIRFANVHGETAAGVWLEYEVYDEAKFEQVPYIPTRYAGLEQFAFLVSGNSMNREEIHDGDYVICVDIAPSPGDRVVAERRRGGLLERTCKLVVESDSGERMLASRSTDPRFSNDVIAMAADGEEAIVIVVGVIIGKFRPFR